MAISDRVGAQVASCAATTHHESRQQQRNGQHPVPGLITVASLLLIGFACGFIASIAVISTDVDAVVGDDAVEFVLERMGRHVLIHIINPDYEPEPIKSHFRRSTTADYNIEEQEQEQEQAQEQEDHYESDNYEDEEFQGNESDESDEDEQDDGVRDYDFVINSCTEDQPLYETYDDYMSPELFARMRDCLINHPEIGPNSLNADGFNHTRGFVTRFGTDAGIDRFFHETKYRCSDGFDALTPFFNASRDAHANAFVMNVLVCDEPSNKDELVVGMHVDDTLAHTLDETHQFFAHTVTVLYISVPDDMEGGQLELLGSDEDNLYPEKVSPKENRMARFRGDSLHQVRGYHTNTKDLRVSLVLEQYRVEEEHVDSLINYQVRSFGV